MYRVYLFLEEIKELKSGFMTCLACSLSLWFHVRVFLLDWWDKVSG
jgi:hypothetical protein